MLRYLIKKEFIQLMRDKRMLPLIFISPVFQLLILGYAANLDVDKVKTVICDQDKTYKSREYTSLFVNNHYFEKVADVNSANEIDTFLDKAEADIAIVIPNQFGHKILSGDSTKVQAIINGTDSTLGTIGLNYAIRINNKFSQNLLIEKITKLARMDVASVDVADRVWYNPDLKSRYYMVPAILAILLMIITMMMTSMAIVREKENGTMEQLIVTPVKRYQIIVGKLIPYILIGLIDIALITLVAVFWFKVPFRGTIFTLYLLSLPFLLNTLAIGLFVSTISNTQQQAMMTVMLFIMMPFINLSGFTFPIENMPRVIQYITYVMPLRHYLEIIRGIFLKGVGINILWPSALILMISGTVILLLSIFRFRKQI